MTVLALALSLFAAAPLFQRIDIPLPSSDPAALRQTAVIPVNANNDKIGDAVILSGYDLTAHDLHSGARLWALRFDAGVSAFDIADVDLDGHPEVIAVRGDAVVRYPTRIEGAIEAVTLFERASLYADDRIQPYPQVLVTERQGQILIGLLTQTGMEYFTTTGARADPAAGDEAPSGEYVPVFSVQFVDPPLDVARDGIEVNVFRSIEYEEALDPEAADDARGRRGTATQARDAAVEDAERWPWFPIKRDEPEALRALYAATEPHFNTTQVRIRQIAALDAETARPGVLRDAITLSPPRKYPGTLIDMEENMPDFNGDGYNDILLWKAKTPGTSVDALARAAAAGVWSIRLTTHVFAPSRQQYAADVAGVLSLDVPIGWLLEMEGGAPIRHLVLKDVNGDGKSDFACGTGERSYGIWLSNDGFGTKPDFAATFNTPIQEVTFSADLNGDGRTAIGLRSAEALHVLHCTAPDKSTPAVEDK